MLKELANAGITVSEEQIIDAFKYISASQRYKPAEVLRILGANMQTVGPQMCREACKSLGSVDTLQFLRYLRTDKDLDALFLTGAVYPLLKQKILESEIDNLIIIGASAWFTSVWVPDEELQPIPTVFLLPDICTSQEDLISHACRIKYTKAKAKVAYENEISDLQITERTAVILFAAAG